jgi:STE24 endopeptidase
MSESSLALIIALALVLIAAIRTFSEVLNLRSIEQPIPESFEGIYDPAAYRNSQDYERETTRFGWFYRFFDLAILLLFWFAGGFGFVDDFVRNFALGPVTTGLVFVGILAVADALIELPFGIYSTFVIEERFGFNRTDLRTFVTDLIKSALVGVALGVPLLAAILLFFDWAGAWAWIYAWAGTTAFSLLVSFVAPAWIMPLFNKFSPLEEGSLRSEIIAYADRVGFPLANVYVMDGSKRSTKSNAFFTGLGKNRRIALFDTLVESQSVAELVVILAHEIGHYQMKHIQKGLVLNIAHFGVLFYLLSIVVQNPTIFAAFGVAAPSPHVGLVLFGVLYTPVSFVLSVALNRLSRKHEFEADRFAVSTTGQGSEMESALKKLSLTNLSTLTPHPLHVFLTYSHPPVLDRIAAIRAEVAHPSPKAP